jgi:hypothetical protein
MKLRVPDMTHDRSDGRTSDIGVLRTGAGNRDEKKQSRKHGRKRPRENVRKPLVDKSQSTMTRLIDNVGELKFSSSPRCK